MQVQLPNADRRQQALPPTVPTEVAAATMPVTRSVSFPTRFAGSVVVIGNFDGVHLGHRHLIDQAASIATAMDAPLGALTFEPHPRTLFSADARHFRIASAGRKCDLLDAAGVDFAVVEPFTPDFGHRSPEEFVREHLVRRLRVRHVVVGDDYRFGCRRTGDIALLRLLGTQLGFGVTALDKAGAEGASVSSTRIRDMLHAGDLGGAERLLGRSWEVRGRVLPPARRGDQGRVVVHLDDADYVRLPPRSYEVCVRDADGVCGLAVAEVPATADGADFTIALRGMPAYARSAGDARVDIAFRCAGKTPAERWSPQFAN